MLTETAAEIAPTLEPIGQTVRKRTRWAALGATLAIAAAAVTGGAWWHARGDGGLPHRHPVAIFTLPPLDPANTSFSLGTPEITEPGKQVQVISVQPLMSPNIEMIGAYAIWPRDTPVSSAGGSGFPDPAYARHHHPLTEVIPPSETSYGITASNPRTADVRLSLGFQVRSGDIGAVNGVLVTYKVNGDTHHKFFAHAVVACVKPNPCTGPDGDRHWEEEVLYNLGLAPKP